MKHPVYLSRPAITSSLGSGLQIHIDALLESVESPPLSYSNEWVKGKKLAFGSVNETLRPFSDGLAQHHHSRTNQLLWHALAQIEPQIEMAKKRYGIERIAVVIGTSTSGADENIPMFEQFVVKKNWQDLSFNQHQHTMAAPADFVAEAYGLNNLCYVVSTACTSGARALISAARLLRSNLCDAVICGGVDSLSSLTINGFNSLEVLSEGIAKPFSANRDGINIGEAAAIFIMTRDADFDGNMQLLGYGASSDAYHMSSPRPDGLGAIQAFQMALNDASLSAQDIGWINLHGTGTKLNDSMESIAIAHVFGTQTLCTSTKAQTGHTLGAAGAIEAAFAWGFVSTETNPHGRLPPQSWDEVADSNLPAIAITNKNSKWPSEKRIAASSSFAFGGNNAILILGNPI